MLPCAAVHVLSSSHMSPHLIFSTSLSGNQLSFSVTQSTSTSENSCLSSMDLYRWAAIFIFTGVTYDLQAVARLAEYGVFYNGIDSEASSLPCMVFCPLKDVSRIANTAAGKLWRADVVQNLEASLRTDTVRSYSFCWQKPVTVQPR